MSVYLLPEEPVFPPVTEAEPDGLLAVGGDLSIERLVSAYTQGIFPWYNLEGEIYWYSPDPRMVLFPEKFRISKSLYRTVHKGLFEVRFDTAFKEVIEACSTVPRANQSETWISPDFIDAYCRLHQAGIAHSVETYLNGKLSGGLYGISLGSAFFGESMFFHQTDASKVAFCHLTEKSRLWNFSLIDCQVESTHFLHFGAELISRHEYLSVLHNALKSQTKKGRWI